MWTGETAIGVSKDVITNEKPNDCLILVCCDAVGHDVNNGMSG